MGHANAGGNPGYCAVHIIAMEIAVRIRHALDAANKGFAHLQGYR
jgi:hypothetical protein